MRRQRIDDVIQLVCRTARDNWDDEGGRAIPLAEWDAMAAFACIVVDSCPKLGEPHFSACGDGTTHARWSDGVRWVEVESRGGDWGVSFSEPIHGRRYHDAPSSGAAFRMVTEFMEEVRGE